MSARDAAIGISAFAVVVKLALADGGYFPEAWGLSIFLFCGIAIAVLILPAIQVGAFEVLMLAGLTSLVGWIALSFLWSIDPGGSMLEVQRTLLYLAGVGGLLIVARRESAEVILAALASACIVVSAYALATRLYPDLLGPSLTRQADAFPLSEPVGYSGALGLVAAMGILLTLGFATRARALASRAFASAGLVPLASTLYFTASRAAFVALAIGLAVALSIDPTRRGFPVAVIPTLAAPVAAVVISARTHALVNSGVSPAHVVRAGHTLSYFLIALAAIATALVYGAGRIECGSRGLFACLALGGLVITGLGIGWANGASSQVNRFRGTSAINANLTGRLTRRSLGGRPDLWSVAWQAAKSEPLLGTGAGSYARSWLRLRPGRRNERSAHNLYLETLSELGPVGLALLLLVLGTPLVAGTRVRQDPFIPTGAGACVAYVVHAGAHWDWQMPVVTLVALGCGGAILIAARRETEDRRLAMTARLGVLTLAVALVGFSFVGLLGNAALGQGVKAAAAGSPSDAKADARRAIHWMPWSGEPWRLRGEVANDEGDVRVARESFRHGLRLDPHNWNLWVDLALTTNGHERVDSILRAARLNPHAPELEGLKISAVGGQGLAGR